MLIFIAPVFGLSDHWKSWNTHQKTIVENIEEFVWLKTVINSAINPIATLAEVKNGKLKNPELNDEVKKLCEESSKIASSNGIKLPLDPWIEIKKIIE